MLAASGSAGDQNPATGAVVGLGAEPAFFSLQHVESEEGKRRGEGVRHSFQRSASLEVFFPEPECQACSVWRNQAAAEPVQRGVREVYNQNRWKEELEGSVWCLLIRCEGSVSSGKKLRWV